MRAPGTARRGGFTLVELLVVVALFIVLAALAAGVAYSGIFDSHKLTGGSDRISGWLLQARAKAARDQAPRGVRLIVGANGFVTELQPIETPEPLNPNPTGDANGFRVVLREQLPATKEVYITANVGTPAYAQLTTLASEISTGDVLTLPEFNSLHRVVSAVAAPGALQQLTNPALPPGAGNPYIPVNAVRINVVDASKLPDLGGLVHPAALPPPASFVPNYSTTQFGFQRVARPTLGEQPLQVTSGIVIDPTICYPPVSNVPGTTVDILFAQNGEVLNAGASGRVILWVRNPAYNPGVSPRQGAPLAETRANYEAAGEMALITVYSKTGAIVTHPVQLPQVAVPTANDPFAFTKDGINSGL